MDWYWIHKSSMHCHQHQSGHCLSTLTIDQDQRQTSQIPINYLLHVVPCQRLGQKPSIICCLNHPILTQKNNHTTPTHGILIKCSFLPNLPIRRPQHTTYTSHYSVFAQSLSLSILMAIFHFSAQCTTYYLSSCIPQQTILQIKIQCNVISWLTNT